MDRIEAMEKAELTQHNGYDEINHPSSKYKVVIGDLDAGVTILEKETDHDVIDLSREDFWKLYEMLTIAAHHSHRRKHP